MRIREVAFMTKIDIRHLSPEIADLLERARQGGPVILTDQGVLIAELALLSPTKIELLKRAETGEVSWNGGKPKGLRGLVIRGEPISETVIRNRR
jgi:hypothetical protein